LIYNRKLNPRKNFKTSERWNKNRKLKNFKRIYNLILKIMEKIKDKKKIA
jgi:hypothetical protein